MKQLISKTLLSGLGLASLAKEAIQKSAEDFVKKSNLSEEEGRRVVKELHRRSSQAQRDMQRTVEKTVNGLLKNLNLAVVHNAPKGAKARRKRKRKSARTAPQTGDGVGESER
jgi:polyhydroxyalkanoate synthesis regulator phasin